MPPSRKTKASDCTACGSGLHRTKLAIGDKVIAASVAPAPPIRGVVMIQWKLAGLAVLLCHGGQPARAQDKNQGRGVPDLLGPPTGRGPRTRGRFFLPRKEPG